MDQSEMLVLLGGLYDKLVKDVAAQVAATTTAVGTLTEDRVNDLAAQVFEERIEAALESYDPSDIVSRELDSRDYESEIDSKVETAVEEALENVDFEDKVKAAVQELRFEVSVR